MNERFEEIINSQNQEVEDASRTMAGMLNKSEEMVLEKIENLEDFVKVKEKIETVKNEIDQLILKQHQSGAQEQISLKLVLLRQLENALKDFAQNKGIQYSTEIHEAQKQIQDLLAKAENLIDVEFAGLQTTDNPDRQN